MSDGAARARVRVLVAEDHALMREGILNRIAQADDIEVVACVQDGGALVEHYRRHSPDVVLTDYSMPVMSGVEALVEIRRIDPAARVLLLSAFEDGRIVADAVAAGAAGYLMKSLPGDELCACIRAAARGEPVFSPEVTRLVMAELGSAARAASVPAVKKLSGREIEILVLVADGLTNAQIAARLYLSPQTVKTHLERISSKLGVKGRTASVRKGISEGLLS